MRSIDLAPTILGRLGIDRGGWPDFDGVDLSPLIFESPASAPRYAYAEAVNMQTYSLGTRRWLKTDKQYAILTNRWKYVQHQIRPEESQLFDLSTDPKELNNLFGQGLAIEKELGRELRRLDPMVEEISGLETQDADTLRALEALGYVN